MPLTRAKRSNGWTTFEDLLHDLGGVAPARVRLRPLPGKATEADLLRILEHEGGLCELVNGVLVEKPLGAPQSCLTLFLDRRLGTFVEEHDLGYTAGPDGPTRLLKGLIRMPDLSFTSWAKMPSKKYTATPVTAVVPNLAVEVLSDRNTRAEIVVKLKEYFLAGVERVWVIDPYKRTVAVHTAPDQMTLLDGQMVLDGGTVLPGFTLSLKELFSRLPEDLRRRVARKGKRGR